MRRDDEDENEGEGGSILGTSVRPYIHVCFTNASWKKLAVRNTAKHAWHGSWEERRGSGASGGSNIDFSRDSFLGLGLLQLLHMEIVPWEMSHLRERVGGEPFVPSRCPTTPGVLQSRLGGHIFGQFPFSIL